MAAPRGNSGWSMNSAAMDEALAYAAKAAKLSPDGWHAEYLGERSDALSALIEQLVSGGEAVTACPTRATRLRRRQPMRRAAGFRMVSDLSYLLSACAARRPIASNALRPTVPGACRRKQHSPTSAGCA